jgi:hypothetical protein
VDAELIVIRESDEDPEETWEFKGNDRHYARAFTPTKIS